LPELPPTIDTGTAVDKIRTVTPIKHVIIIVGENRSFDHLFATYVPKNKEDRVRNLLSEKIINADGSPGPNFAKAHQFQIASAPNGGKYFSSADLKNKALYSTLPAPDVGGIGAVSPYEGILSLPGGDPGLPPQDQFLFGTGAVTTCPILFRMATMTTCRAICRRLATCSISSTSITVTTERPAPAGLSLPAPPPLRTALPLAPAPS